MARGKARFTHKEVTRAIKAARDGGTDVSRVEIEPNGKIVLVIGKPAEPPNESINEWDVVP